VPLWPGVAPSDPSGVLHITAFVTLSEAYLGIDPQFNLWNYFIHVQHPQDPDTEVTISREGGEVILVKSRHGVNPYYDIPMPRSMKGWWKKWFYLKNDASALLPMLTGNHLSYPVLRKRERSLHTCAQDVQITRMVTI
jgi:hypothetical protein